MRYVATLLAMSTTEQRAPGWTADASTFGARLALIRQRMGWSNVAMAARACGVPVDSWRNWEVDGREPHRLTTIAMTIATTAGCDYLWLVHGPERGAVTTRTGATNLTDEYAPVPDHGIGRLIATIGQPERQRPTTRPVSQTQPAHAIVARPAASLAV